MLHVIYALSQHSFNLLKAYFYYNPLQIITKYVLIHLNDALIN